jgi:CheY-like chemotaxis protein
MAQVLPFSSILGKWVAKDGRKETTIPPNEKRRPKGMKEAPGGPPAPLRILVADDNRDAADSLSTLLRIWGFETQVVYDGTQVLPAAGAYRPDCMLLDIGLPGINGYRLAELIRQDEELRRCTLIAITAYAEEGKAREAGFDAHLIKPADPTVVEFLLRRLQAMGKRVEQAEHLARQGLEVVTEARDLIKEVKIEMKEVREELREVKEDVKEVKQELREVKEQQEKS